MEEDLLLAIVGWLLGILSWVGLNADPPIHFFTGNDPQRLRVQCPRSTQRCPNMQGNGETSRSPLAWQQFVGLEAWDLTST